MSPENLDLFSASLQKYFDRELHASTYEQLRQWLIQEVNNLLLNDMEKLLHILYRVDVNEKKFKAAFATDDAKGIAPAIADLMMERELQKVESRIKYRKFPDDR